MKLTNLTSTLGRKILNSSAPQMIMTSIHHPSIGEIRGRQSGNVVQFLGIKYGDIKERFGPPSLHEAFLSENGGIIDATSYGNSVFSSASCEDEFKLLQHRLPCDPDGFEESDLDGLNLHITVPKDESSRLLPVMVFIHGGAFAGGSPAWPQNNLARFVEMSQNLHMPVIGVTINYRVGHAGFLTSEELRRADLTSNNGLRDQRIALAWLKKHIAGFNGDPENITLIGQSAGAVAGMLHLASDEPLFKRIACLGGQSLVIQPLPAAVHEEFYAAITQELGLDTLSIDERIKALQELDPERLKKAGSFPSRPVFDESICISPTTFAGISHGIPEELHKGWCEEIFIGDCGFDASIFSGALEARSNIASHFISHIDEKFPHLPELSRSLATAYGIDEAADNRDALTSVLNFGHDIAFYAPAVAVAKAWKGSAYMYHFNEPNPWDGRWKGHPCHLADIAFLWHNYDEFLTEDQRAVGAQFSQDLLAFGNGRAPWSFFRDSDPYVRTYGPSSEGSIFGASHLRSSDAGRRSVIFDFIGQAGADALLEEFMSFLIKQ